MESKFSLRSFAWGAVTICFLANPYRVVENIASQGAASWRNIQQSFAPPIEGHSARLAANIEAFTQDLVEMEASMSEVDNKKSRK